MDPTKIAELEAATAAAKQAAEEAGGTDEVLNKALSDAEATLLAAKTPSQTPVQQEIDRQEKGKKKTEAEKAAFTLQSTAARLRELGGNPEDVLGMTHGEPIATEDDSRPMTVGEFKRMQGESNTKTALELADHIPDEHERKLTKEYLTMFSPTVAPQEAVRVARLAVNSVKNGQIVEEIGRKTPAAGSPSGPGAPAKQVSTEPAELTAAEIPFTLKPFSMTPAEIIAKRPKT